MAETVSAMLTNWMMIVRTLIASMRTNAAAIGAALESEIHPDNPQNRVEEATLARAKLLERKMKAYRRKARAVSTERGDDQVVDVERQTAVGELNDLVVDTRSLFGSAYPAEILALLGLSGPTPDNIDALEEYAANVRDRLRTETLPEPRRGITIDVAVRATMLDEALTRVARSQDAFTREDRQEQSALSARNRAEEDLRRTYIGVADGFVADAILAGLTDVAERARSTANRRKGLPEEADRELPLEDDAEDELDDATLERELVTGADDEV